MAAELVSLPSNCLQDTQGIDLYARVFVCVALKCAREIGVRSGERSAKKFFALGKEEESDSNPTNINSFLDGTRYREQFFFVSRVMSQKNDNLSVSRDAVRSFRVAYNRVVIFRFLSVVKISPSFTSPTRRRRVISRHI